jgi:hypothetical protein
LVEGPAKSRAPRLISLPAGHKTFYLAALACTGPLFASLLNCAGECLKLAGITASDAESMLLTQAERATRSFLKGGRKLSQEPPDLDRQIAALRSRNPQLAEFFEQNAKLARGPWNRPPGLSP